MVVKWLWFKKLFFFFFGESEETLFRHFLKHGGGINVKGG